MKHRFGDEERRMMRIVPAPAVRLMKRRASSRSGVNSLLPFGNILGKTYKTEEVKIMNERFLEP